MATRDAPLTDQPSVKPLKVKAGRKRTAAEISLRMRSAKRLRCFEQRSLKRTGILLENSLPKALKGPTALGPILKERFNALA